MNQTTRRNFLAVSGAAAAAGAVFSGSGIPSAQSAENAQADAPKSLFASAVVLQNPTETSMSASWTLNGYATGWVEWGLSPDKLDQKACGAVWGLKPYSDRVISVTINGLKPNTKYFYRAAVRGIDFRGAYKIIPNEEVEYTEVNSFTTPGKDAKTASFVVVNDTHEVQDILAREFDLAKELKPDYTIWNGDLVNHVEGHETIQNAIMDPGKRAFANDHPLLVGRGNHDTRGRWARYLDEYLTPWKQEDPKYAALGYSSVVRHGDLALICLDTGEDKPDFRKEWGTLAEFEPYIALQGEWLKDVMGSDAVKTAKFVLVFCHIPLFDPRPDANPGTLEYGHSAWKKLGAELWGESLQKAGVQAVIAAHVHHHRVDAPTETRCWTQITGGGCALNGATVIHGKVENDKLKITVYSVATKKAVTELEFEPRKIG